MLPSLEEARRLLACFCSLVMDGYAPAPSLGLPAAAGARADGLAAELEDLARRCGFAGDAAAAARAVAASVPGLRERIALDVDAVLRNDPAARSREEVEACYPGIHAVAAYRLAHRILRAGVPVLPRMLGELAHGATGIDINPGARIGHSFFIDHGTGVVIGETSDVGDRVILYHGVTLGALSFHHDASGQVIRVEKRHPTVEDDVVIYSNASILGGDTVVGRGCIIGANVRVTSSVPPDTVVMQQTPRLHQLRRSPKA
ncbi:MAG: serine acetyltransferase [Planctomycetota bacterium]|nr:MAG: serine acetyltransferase [Planctomycetota bacterium]